MCLFFFFKIFLVLLGELDVLCSVGVLDNQVRKSVKPCHATTRVFLAKHQYLGKMAFRPEDAKLLLENCLCGEVTRVRLV